MLGWSVLWTRSPGLVDMEFSGLNILIESRLELSRVLLRVSDLWRVQGCVEVSFKVSRAVGYIIYNNIIVKVGDEVA